MKRILILGASVLQLPAIYKAKEMGLYVGVIDYNPDAIGISFADEYFNKSTFDERGVYEVAKVFKADGIMTLATDMPMRSIAYTCERLGLPGISQTTAMKTTDKGEMIKAFKAHNVEHPWFHILNSFSEAEQLKDSIQYPCICKPTDSSGSRGVILIKDKLDFCDGIKYSFKNSPRGHIIIEEYLQGNEVSVEIIVIDGKPHILQVTDKLTTGAPHFVEMGHSQPSSLADENVEKIKELAGKAALSVGIQNGPAHAEIIMTSGGSKMVEIGARLGGDCITTHLVPLSTGIDMVKAVIQMALGEKPNLEKKIDKGAAIRYFNAPQGVIKEIIGVEKAKAIAGIYEITFVKKVNDYACHIDSSVDRIGYVIAQDTNSKQAILTCESAIMEINIKTI